MTLKMNSILEQGVPLSAIAAAASSSCSTLQLPSEVTLLILEHLEWGDYARLACVQKSWSNIMYTAAADAPNDTTTTSSTGTSTENSCCNDKSNNKQWELAQALLKGTHGLRVNTGKAMELLLQLANVPVDPTTQAPIAANNNSSASSPSSPASLSFAPAMRLIADFYLEGGSTCTSCSSTTSTTNTNATTLGLQWLQSAFELGNDVEAAHALALIYEHGSSRAVKGAEKIIDVDVVQAAHWLTKAAEAGHVEAMAELALCFELGCGVEQSDEKALEWYLKAAEQGSRMAKFSVGEAFEEAKGVPQSHEEACLWYYKAAVEGDDDAKAALRRLRDIARIVLPGVGSLLDG